MTGRVRRAVEDAWPRSASSTRRTCAGSTRRALEFFERLRPHDRPVIAEHRAEVSEVLADAAALVIAGGHVGVLAEVLHLFNVAAALRSAPVIAWSAGRDGAGRPDRALP